MQATSTLSKKDQAKMQKLRLKASRRDQYKRYTRTRGGNAIYTIILLLFGAFSILPMIYCIITSFKPLDELLIFPPKFYVVNPTRFRFPATRLTACLLAWLQPFYMLLLPPWRPMF